MKIIFFGLGGIGSKHLNLLRKHFNHELYAFRTPEGGHKRLTPPDVCELNTWDMVDAHKPEVAFITNPTHLHIKIAMQCAKRGMHLFIEKPIDCKTAYLYDLLEIVKQKNLTAYVAYPFRHHPRIKILKALLAYENFDISIAVCRTHFNAWGKEYSRYRYTGGGAILELSHEIDYVDYLFGPITDLTGIASRRGNVTVDTEDFANIVARHKQGRTDILLDINDSVEERHIQLLGSRINIDAPLKAAEEMYHNQLEFFFDNIGNPRIMNGLHDAVRLFKMMIEFRDRNCKL